MQLGRVLWKITRVAEICHEDARALSCGSDENIVRLKVPVNNVALMKILYAFENLAKNDRSFDIWETTAPGLDV